MSDTTVNLDGFIFRDMEIPEDINFGGEQTLSIQRYIGGKRTIDAMGADEDPLEWSGTFRGQDATDRALLLNAKRKAGRPVTLTFGRLAFTVVIAKFTASYERFYEIPYRITLEVVSDDTAPPAESAEVGVDEMVLSDMLAAQEETAALRDPPLSLLMGSVSSAVTSAGSLATAAPSTVTKILQPIAAVQDRVSELIGAAEAITGSVSALGGVIPGLAGVDLTSGLLAQVTAMGDSARLYNIQSIMGRMTTNLQAVGQSGAEITVVGADLFGLAQQHYGDASEWATIAAANGITDPNVVGLQTLLIPPTSRKTGGILTN